jgi:hypothetical protein
MPAGAQAYPRSPPELRLRLSAFNIAFVKPLRSVRIGSGMASLLAVISLFSPYSMNYLGTRLMSLKAS